MFCHLLVNAQIGTMDIKSTRTETVFVGFLSNFNHDVTILYAKDIEVYKNIFYWKEEIGSSKDGCEIFMTVDQQVVNDIVTFEGAGADGDPGSYHSITKQDVAIASGIIGVLTGAGIITEGG